MNTSTPSTLTFAELGLSEPILRALTEKKYTTPSPIQAEAIPHLLAGRDLMGSAQTGTGKTAAFALPILQRLSATNLPRVPLSPRALILTPTRELAVQIDASFAAYGKHLHMKRVLIYGGVGQHPQVHGMKIGPDIVIATPGRLMDLMQQGYVRFDRVEIFVLDEADRMLDMGFAPDVKRILAKIPAKRQSLLFSATLPQSILALASSILNKPVRVEMTPETPTADRVIQRVCPVAERGEKYPLLRQILQEHAEELVLIFTRTKHGAKKLAANLARDGYPAGEIHGNKSQSARQTALETFRSGRKRVLVATDVAARGIDVKGIALVVNFDLPNEPEAYIHRIGRTARAGQEGLAISFCDRTERGFLRHIQSLLRTTIPVYKSTAPASPAPARESAPPAAAETPRPASTHRVHHTPQHRPHSAPTHREERPAQRDDRPARRDDRPSYAPRQHSAPEHREYRQAPAARSHHADDSRDQRPAPRSYPAPHQSEHRSPYQARKQHNVEYRDNRSVSAPRPAPYRDQRAERPYPSRDDRFDSRNAPTRSDYPAATPRHSRPHPVSSPRGYGNRPPATHRRSSQWERRG